MRLIRPDAQRRIDLPGAPGPVPRPVDIGQAQTGFQVLRTLRIYRFEPGTRIEGHAEEDEVFIVALDGHVELDVRAPESPERHLVLAAADAAAPHAPCAVYLPAHGTYVLCAPGAAEIAYARATPRAARAPASFAPPQVPQRKADLPVVLDVGRHADRLRLQVLHGTPARGAARAELFGGGGSPGEALLHVRALGAAPQLAVRVGARCEALASGDTVVIGAGEPATLEVAAAEAVTALLVWGE
ncbi:MAG: 5-deoxy-glucuronate isomerase [Gammaproteobacteria bacterium]|nr:5-deoxy-glucuronate isomerase [Gammaproteobacteria bacterium]